MGSREGEKEHFCGEKRKLFSMTEWWRYTEGTNHISEQSRHSKSGIKQTKEFLRSIVPCISCLQINAGVTNCQLLLLLYD